VWDIIVIEHGDDFFRYASLNQPLVSDYENFGFVGKELRETGDGFGSMHDMGGMAKVAVDLKGHRVLDPFAT
jgi:hypothetical protein